MQDSEVLVSSCQILGHGLMVPTFFVSCRRVAASRRSRCHQPIQKEENQSIHWPVDHKCCECPAVIGCLKHRDCMAQTAAFMDRSSAFDSLTMSPCIAKFPNQLDQLIDLSNPYRSNHQIDCSSRQKDEPSTPSPWNLCRSVPSSFPSPRRLSGCSRRLDRASQP